MIKNKSGQKIAIFAWDSLNNVPKTGDAANITARYRKSGGTITQSNDVNPTEAGSTYMPGVYEFDPTADETNCNELWWYAMSSTANVWIEPIFFYPKPDVPATFGTVDDAGATTTVFKTDLTEATTDHFKDSYLHFLTGANAGQSRKITGYVLDGGVGKFTCTAFTDAPVTGDKFVVLGRSE